jgi:hypothetical protein
VRTFTTVAELVEALRAFERAYNERSLIGRHGLRTPGQVQRDLQDGVQVAIYEQTASAGL